MTNATMKMEASNERAGRKDRDRFRRRDADRRELRAVLAGYGVNVVIADINEADGKQVANGIGAKASFIRTDITSDDDIAALVAATVERHGRLDFLVNVACTYLDNGAETARADWLKALDVNIVGSVMLMQAARPHLEEEQGRHRQFRLDLGPHRPGRALGLSGLEGRDPATDAQPGARPRAGRHQGQRRLAGLDLEQHHEGADGNDRAKTDSVAAPFHLLRRTGDPSEVAEAVAFLLVGRGELHHRHRHPGRRRLHARSAPSGSIRRSRC